MNNQQLAQNYQQVLARIAKTNHSQKVSLLAVSKTKPIEQIQALVKLGQNSFGENYLQEALSKIAVEPNLN